MARGSNYLYNLCRKKELENERRNRELLAMIETLQMLLEIVAAEAGSLTIQTDGMKERLEGYEIKYYTCEEEHKIRIDAIKK